MTPMKNTIDILEEIRSRLFELQDNAYRDFQSRLIPTVDPSWIIGVRTPALRSFAKELARSEEIGTFLDDLPHRYFDEDQLHAFIISGIKDFGDTLDRVDRFLPYVNNWATCDQMSPKIFKKHRQELLPSIKKWIASEQVYTIRFGIGMLMEHFLDEDFDIAYPQMVAEIRSDEYYVRMMQAWYFATALAKRYDAVLPFLTTHQLEPWTHNKTIQKAVESYRITEEQKNHLKSLKIK